MPDFIEAGFDILNPVQTSAAHMDPQELKTCFGKEITFWGGGVDTQRTLPFGTADEVRAEVRERMRIFGAGGGFVFNTIHNVQVASRRRICLHYTKQCGTSEAIPERHRKVFMKTAHLDKEPGPVIMIAAYQLELPRSDGSTGLLLAPQETTPIVSGEPAVGERGGDVTADSP